MSGTTYFFSNLTMDITYTQLVILNASRMFGMSMVMMPVSTNGLNQLPARFYPHGTAMNNTLNQVAAAIGTAALITVMSTRTKTHGAELAANALKHITGQQPTAAALVEVKQQIAMKAMLEGINDAFFGALLISFVALLLAFFIKRSKQAEDPGESIPIEKKNHKKAAEF